LTILPSLLKRKNLLKGMSMNDICKFCSEPLPKLALHFSNRIAIELGYCCFMCMRSDLGDDEAYKRLARNIAASMGQNRGRERRE